MLFLKFWRFQTIFSFVSSYYDIEHLLKRRKSTNGTYEYLVRWKNYSPLDDTWEPAENINNNELLQTLDNVYQRYEQNQANDWKILKYIPLKILSDDVINNELVFLTIIKVIDFDLLSKFFFSLLFSQLFAGQG